MKKDMQIVQMMTQPTTVAMLKNKKKERPRTESALDWFALARNAML